MKTNVIMVSQLDNLEIHRQTKNGFWNLTKILQHFCQATGEKRIMADFLRLKQTRAFIKELEKQEKMGNPIFSGCGKA